MKKSVSIKEFAALLGDEAAERANDAWEGRSVYFPKKRHMVQFGSQEEKEQHIKNLWYVGYSPEEIAAKLELTPKYIRDIVRMR